MAALALGQREDNLPGEITRFIGRRWELPAMSFDLVSGCLVAANSARSGSRY